MGKFKIEYIANCDEVCNSETQAVVFSTKVPDEIRNYVDRKTIVCEVVNKVVSIWNNSTGSFYEALGEVDLYLLDESLCTQDERELIVVALHDHNKCNE